MKDIGFHSVNNPKSYLGPEVEIPDFEDEEFEEYEWGRVCDQPVRFDEDYNE